MRIDLDKLHAELIGKTIADVNITKLSNGFGGAMDCIEFCFTDASSLTLRPGSYTIPEDCCIYGEGKRL